MGHENRGPAPPGSILIEDGAPAAPIRPVAAATSVPPGPTGGIRRPAAEAGRPGQAGPPRPPGAPREPSWARVLLTTIKLWGTRRLRRVGFGQPSTVNHPRRNWLRRRAADRHRPTAGRWKLAACVLAVAVVALAALQLSGAFTRATTPASRAGQGTGPAGTSETGSLSAVAAARAEAARWIAQQVSTDAIVACDPVMCSVLQAHGVTAGRLLALRSGAADPLGADVIVASPTIRSQFGSRLASEYAPALIGSFGSGGTRIDVRATAPDGAAAYESALRADLAARKSAGAQLLRNRRLQVTARDAARLRSGQVDSRLLVTLAVLASQDAYRVTSFSDAAPGAGAAFREVTITSPAGTGRAGRGRLSAAIGLMRAQRPPYLPAHSAIVGLGTSLAALHIEFAAPSPVGLLSGGNSA
jgi:hypothetical protein